jgi:hypothetical protein
VRALASSCPVASAQALGYSMAPLGSNDGKSGRPGASPVNRGLCLATPPWQAAELDGGKRNRAKSGGAIWKFRGLNRNIRITIANRDTNQGLYEIY